MPIDSRPRDAQVRPMPSSASTRRFFLGRPPGALPHSLSHSTLSFASASSSRTFLLSTRALFFALFCSRSARNVFPCRPPCVSKPHTGAQLIPSSANMSGTLSVHTDECNEGDEGSTVTSKVKMTLTQKPTLTQKTFWHAPISSRTNILCCATKGAPCGLYAGQAASCP